MKIQNQRAMKARQIVDEWIVREKYDELRVTYPQCEADEPTVCQMHFPSEGAIKEVQVSLVFRESWLEVLTVPRPQIFKAMHAVVLMNTLNKFAQQSEFVGSFYFDCELGLVHSTRIPYDYLELAPTRAIAGGVLSGLSIFDEIGDTLCKVGSGEFTAEDASEEIIEMFM